MSGTADTDRRDAQLQALGALVDLPLADDLGRRFAAAGHELHLVGGTVRDRLMGVGGDGDLDFATSARPEETERLLGGWADAVWGTGARFGTISATRDGVGVEITTFRSEAYAPGSRHPEVTYGDDIAGDLARRDLTVNAIAVRVPDRLVTDPFGGWEDLRAGVLRTPVDPRRSFEDDPLRMLRLARFTATLGFRPDEAAVRAATAMAGELATVAPERMRLELDKLVVGAHAAAGLDLMVGTGLADVVLPELPALRMQRDPGHHHKDVYAHTLAVVEGCPRDDVVLRLAALLHDVGKPATRQLHPDGTVSFHHHDVVGARMARHRLRELRYPRDVVRDVGDLVRLHLRFHGYADGEWTDSAVRRYVADAGTPEQLRRLNLLTRADVTTAHQGRRRRFARAMDDLEARVASLQAREALEAVRPAVDGHQIMAFLGSAPGPLVGRAWAHLKELALDRGPMTEDEGFDALAAWAAANDVPVAGVRLPRAAADTELS
jgi:poly(A) polymerase